jgi:5-methyltetrahydropteroyltriglutamate--homocysteine methyltransferase
VADVLFAQEAGVPLDEAGFDAVMTEAVADTVARQRAVGIGIPSDGEMSKISYATYIKYRLSGFDGDSPRIPPADLEEHRSYLESLARSGGTATYRRPKCVGPVKVKDLAPLHDDIRRFRNALEQAHYPGGFMNSATPGVISLFQPNEFYPSTDDYREAVAEAMREEYEAIVAAGLILQLDSPDLGLGRHTMYKSLPEKEFLRAAETHIETLNQALRNIPADRMRIHVCWGNYEGPHTCDIALETILPLVLRARPRTLLFEAANPRHAHEWTIWQDAKLPEDYVLVPGTIDSTTNFVEHPKLVAERIFRFTNLVGRDRVIAGTDCGFGTFAGYGPVDPEIAWEKLKSLVEGAELASASLTPRRPTEAGWQAAAAGAPTVAHAQASAAGNAPSST